MYGPQFVPLVRTGHSVSLLTEFLLLLVSVLTGLHGRELSALSPTPNLEDQGSTLIVWSLPFNFSGMSAPTTSRKLQPTVGWRGFLKSCT